MKTLKCTLEEKLLNDGWFSDTTEMEPWVMAHRVLVNNQVVTSRKEKIPVDAEIRIKEYYKRKYVNKGGLKLEGALKDFEINVEGKVALDCGASTGGFTDCLLASQAAMVYAVDIGFDQLSGKLLGDSRVINMEKTNLEDDILLHIEPKPEVISLDLSYLSLKKAVPICENILKDKCGTIICLIKPLFEVSSGEIRRSGNINDRKIFKEILSDLYYYFTNLGYYVIGITNSPITGNKGTIEFFIGLSIGSGKHNSSDDDIDSQIELAIEKGMNLDKFRK